MDHGHPADIIASSNDDGPGIARGAPKLSRRSTQLTKMLPFRVPGFPGMDTFDKHCVFGNRVRLTKDQIFFLRNQVATKKPYIPYYVCAMTKANVAPGKRKMKFLEKYTADHLQRFLEEPMDVLALYPRVCDCYNFVRLKNGKDGRAMIISQ